MRDLAPPVHGERGRLPASPGASAGHGAQAYPRPWCDRRRDRACAYSLRARHPPGLRSGLKLSQ